MVFSYKATIKAIKLLPLIVIITGSFGYGVLVGRYKIFPFQEIYFLQKLITPELNSLTRNNIQRIDLFETFRPSAKTVFIGDSITDKGLWNDFFSEIKVSNRGISGDKTSDVLQRIDSLYSTRTEIAFIMLGINDIYADIPLDEIVSNYKTIVETLKNLGISVIIQSTIQCQVEICGKRKVLKVNLLNKKLESLALEKNITFIKFTELSNQNGLSKKYTHDGIHLSSLGYQKLVDKIKEFGLEIK